MVSGRSWSPVCVLSHGIVNQVLIFCTECAPFPANVCSQHVSFLFIGLLCKLMVAWYLKGTVQSWQQLQITNPVNPSPRTDGRASRGGSRARCFGRLGARGTDHLSAWGLAPSSGQRGIIPASGRVTFKVDGSQKRPAGTFFQKVQFEIRDVFCFVIWFHSHNKEECTLSPQDDENHGLIFYFQKT